MNIFKKLFVIAGVITNVTACTGGSDGGGAGAAASSQQPGVVNNGLAYGVCLTPSGEVTPDEGAGLLDDKADRVFIYKHGYTPNNPNELYTSITYLAVESGSSLDAFPVQQVPDGIRDKNTCQVLQLRQEYGEENLDGDILALNNCKTETLGSLLKFTSKYTVYNHYAIEVGHGEFDFQGKLDVTTGLLVQRN